MRVLAREHLVPGAPYPPRNPTWAVLELWGRWASGKGGNRLPVGSYVPPAFPKAVRQICSELPAELRARLPAGRVGPQPRHLNGVPP